MALNDSAQGHNQRNHDGPGERGQAGNNGCRLDGPRRMGQRP